jgi:hypothetical protein
LDDFLRFQIDDQKRKLKPLRNHLHGFLTKVFCICGVSDGEVELAIRLCQFEQSEIEIVLAKREFEILSA